MMGVQGLYNDGWMLSAVPVRPPWDLLGKAIDRSGQLPTSWSCTTSGNDWTQYTDVAAANPAKLREMRDLMFGEFAKYQVLPLDASVATRMVTPRPSMTGGTEGVHLLRHAGHRHTARRRHRSSSIRPTHHRRGRRAAGRRRGHDRHRMAGGSAATGCTC